MADATAPSATSLPPGSSTGATAPLDEVMLAMDVVDTLRHAERLVERELSAEQREADLKNRLREIYRSQGIDVSDSALDEGVAALREERFAYRPSAPGLARSLALLWVQRSTWLRPLSAAFMALLLGLGAYWAFWKLPEQHRLTQEKTELVAQLPNRISAEFNRIAALALDKSVLPEAERLKTEGEAAAKAGDLQGARAKADELLRLRTTLEQTYVIRVVSSPKQRSGVFRIPKANPNARNYYLIVEAIGPDGQALPVLVNSEEDGRAERVTQWGVRVGQDQYDRIRLDKQDDGIIQGNRVGEKRKGYRQPDYSVPVLGGAILDW
ncbi:MAG: DUF6384 family protein [Methylococcaceae bacterium]|nr:DUF6384 family protein [Methylococcaceae bacterium]